jgi:hypothetical protein
MSVHQASLPTSGVHAVRVNNVMTRALRALFLMMLMGVLKSVDVRRVVKTRYGDATKISRVGVNNFINPCR